MRRGLALASGIILATASTAQADNLQHGPRTPIKHLIVVIGENHSFDNVFATYVPPDRTQSVWNLLSLGIVDQNGDPGLESFSWRLRIDLAFGIPTSGNFGQKWGTLLFFSIQPFQEGPKG